MHMYVWVHEQRAYGGQVTARDTVSHWPEAHRAGSPGWLPSPGILLPPPSGAGAVSVHTVPNTLCDSGIRLRSSAREPALPSQAACSPVGCFFSEPHFTEVKLSVPSVILEKQVTLKVLGEE